RSKIDPPPPLRSITGWPTPATAPDWAGQIDTFLAARLAGTTDPKELDRSKEFRNGLLTKAKANDESKRTAAVLIWRRRVADPSPRPETVADLSALLDEVSPSPTTEAQA